MVANRSPIAHRRAPRRATHATTRRVSTPPREANEFSARTHRVSKPRLEKTERGASRCDVFGVGRSTGFYHPIPWCNHDSERTPSMSRGVHDTRTVHTQKTMHHPYKYTHDLLM